jgi:hypothetical protein
MVRKIETKRLPAGEGRADSTLDWYEAAGHRFFVLAQRGRFQDNCYDHGRLLANEIEEGVFAEAIDTIRVDTDVPVAWQDAVADALYARINREVEAACSPEFRQGMTAIAQGYFSGHADPEFSADDVVAACLAIDVGNIATGFTRRLKKYLAPENRETLGYAIGAVVQYRSGRFGANVRAEASHDPGSVARALAQRERRRPRPRMGCTGFAVAADRCADGRGLHARNFDGAFFSWCRHPGLFLIDERPADPGYHRYAAVGTAGLIYAGGISGMNDQGIAVSLHQMSTVNYTTGNGDGTSEIAPFTQQRVLREAATLDEAVDLVRSIRHFASWTIVVSDARAGRSLRIELTGREDAGGRYDGRVVASEPAPWLSQSNHFLGKALEEKNRFFEDAHFTKTLGKWLETRSRREIVDWQLGDAVAGREVDTDMALNLLADHHDATAGRERRSFGRTICKAYSLMSTIARPDHDRDRADDGFWFTIGERMPGPHSTLVGLAIDWEGLSALPVARRPMRKAQSISAPFADALAAYCAAFETLERPRVNGRYLGRAPTQAEEITLRTQALTHLDRAVRLAEDAGELDPGFRYVRARLLHEARRFAEARRDWQLLRNLANSADAAKPLVDYEQALVHILSAATEAALGEEDEARRLIDRGLALLARVEKRLFPAGVRPHQHLNELRKVAGAIRADGAEAELPAIDWVTVE